MKSTAKHNYSEAQTAYMVAQAAWTVTSKADVTSDVYCDAFQLKCDAERALFAWAANVVATDPKTAAKYGQVAHVFTQVWKFPSMRSKLVDICMKLDAGVR